ncbi:MAG: ATP-binding protein [Muribaculaceae bacterium]|nr:ATP-binding protein [Muribaculaceae bacterium]
MELNTKYISREMTASIIEAARYFSVITVTGPRQSGKSTLLRHIYPDIPYLSFENPDTRLMAKSDPRALLLAYSDGVIIDEVQNVPELLSYLQEIVDLEPNRRYYLTGSSQFDLIKEITQSLAGRSAVFELLPLSMKEISDELKGVSVDEIIYKGFYPAIWSNRNTPALLYPNYTKTYLERDVRTLLGVRDLDAFQRFIRLCAARIGSIFNASELSNEIGVSVNTINSWVSVLRASYLIYLLPPFFTNTRKRLTKSPKIYFTDCGLASYLLDIDSPQIVNRDKMRGHLFENLVITNILKNRLNEGKSPQIYFFRDSNGNEVDLLVKTGSTYRCIEIKSSSTFHPSFLHGLKSFDKAFPELTDEKAVIYTGESMPDMDGIRIRNVFDELIS